MKPVPLTTPVWAAQQALAEALRAQGTLNPFGPLGACVVVVVGGAVVVVVGGRVVLVVDGVVVFTVVVGAGWSRSPWRPAGLGWKVTST